MNNTKLLNFYIKNGYVILKMFSSKEIDSLKYQIKKKIKKKYKSFNPKKTLKILHKINLSDQKKNEISKSNFRFINLNKKIIEKIRYNKSINQILEHHWGNNRFSIKIIRSKFRKDIIDNSCGFRITEPHKKSIGIHSDAAFFSKVIQQKINMNFLKSLWIPLEGFDKQYTLRISPKSHLKEHPKNKFKKKNNQTTYFFKKSYSETFKYQRMNFKKGELMLFNPNLLHGDSHNKGDFTRVSLEIRLYNPEEIINWKFN